jgi:hypothetical protein
MREQLSRSPSGSVPGWLLVPARLASGTSTLSQEVTGERALGRTLFPGATEQMPCLWHLTSEHMQEGGASMNHFPEPVQRRQTLIRSLGLVAIGIGRCPTCQQRTEVFARRSATSGPTRECCLDCWMLPR